jgi:hypothetical protein
MEHRNIASIAGENMMLCDTDNFATKEFNVPEGGKFNGRGKPA